jgi:hypothetical protein
MLERNSLDDGPPFLGRHWRERRSPQSLHRVYKIDFGFGENDENTYE